MSSSTSAGKARGAYFTPEALCRFLVTWAIRTPDDRVLEPAAGEAAFLLAAASRLAELSADPAGRLTGVELHAESADTARQAVRDRGYAAELRVANFFAVPPEPAYDAVVGNPPYVRYQGFTGADRAMSRAAALRAGVRLTNLASSWAAFTVHAALFLAPGGRLGLVLPAELLSVNYAAQVREFLMRRFARVRIVVFTERVFPGVLEEVVLLLAEGEGPTDHCELVQVRDADQLEAITPGQAAARWAPASAADKWIGALAPGRAVEVLDTLGRDQAFTPLSRWGRISLGMVTGANSFFALSPATARRLHLDVGELLPLSPPGSRHLRALRLSRQQWTALGDHGASTRLFRPPDQLSSGGRRYVAYGEAIGVERAYKCRIRTPWWRVPLVRTADVLLTYMNADTPRLCANPAGLYHLNSVHGLYLDDAVRDLGAALLPLAALNSATALGAELVGRSYGGGMLKLEPREAARLPVPSPALLAAAAPGLRRIEANVRADLAAGRPADAVERVDAVLLPLAAGAAGIEELRAGVAGLRGRRAARGGTRGTASGGTGGGTR